MKQTERQKERETNKQIDRQRWTDRDTSRQKQKDRYYRYRRGDGCIGRRRWTNKKKTGIVKQTVK